MNFLILLVIAIFIITAGYVGYHASQNQSVEEIKGHEVKFETLNIGTNSIQSIQNLKLDISII